MKRFLLLAIAHFVVLFGLMIVTVDFSAVDGDGPTHVAWVAIGLIFLLGNPGFTVYDALGPGLSDATEWSIYIGNSFVWGGALTLLLRLRRRRDA